jgi:hypothetical protein
VNQPRFKFGDTVVYSSNPENIFTIHGIQYFYGSAFHMPGYFYKDPKWETWHHERELVLFDEYMKMQRR